MARDVSETTSGGPEFVIEPGGGAAGYWRDIWRYRELFYFFSWRDVLVRYKQTAIGVAWSVLRPLLTMAVFTVIFGRIAKLPSGGVPYPIMVFAAMLPWQFFANALADSSNSLVSHSGMLTKVYFPRIIIPASSVIVGLVDFLISFLILAALMLWYGVTPGWRFLAVPIFLALAFVASFGFGLLFSALNVRYRDFRHIVPFVVQVGLYISPVGFSSEVIPERWRLVYSLNPMVGVIDGFRWAVLGGRGGLYLPGVVLSAVVSALVLLPALAYFRKTERGFADVI